MKTLQAAVVEQCLPTYAPGAVVLHLGSDVDDHPHIAAAEFAVLGIAPTEHVSLPDIVAHDKERDRLLLIEVATSRGPVSPMRKEALENWLSDCSLGRVYVTAFPDFELFSKHAADIAWETEVWIAEAPDHLVHFDGGRILGPRSQ